MKLFAKLQSIDYRIIYLLVFVLLSAALIFPIKVPMVVSKEVQNVYDIVESLEPGTAVMFSSDWESSVAAECVPQTEALIRHMFNRNLRVVIMGQWPQGNASTDEITERIAQELGKEYGKDWCNLGYKPGGAAVLSAMAEDIKAVFPEDNRGNAYDSLEVCKGLSNIEDFGLITVISWGDPGHLTWVKMVQTPYGVPMVAGVTAARAADTVPFVQSGQIGGLLSGLGGAAEYENLVDYPGKATAGMGAQSVGHGLVLALVIIGNLGYFASKKNNENKGV